MPSGTSDQELLAAYVGCGDQGAFATLVTRHAPLVHAACRRRLGDADADDAAQAVFLLVARRASRLARDPRPLAPWLFTAAGLVARNHQRSAGRRREQELAMAEPTSAPEPELWPDVRVHLDAALDDLPAAYRAPLILHYLDGHDRAEIGPALGLSAEALKKRLSRGLELLRRALLRRGVAVPASGLVALLTQAQIEAAEGAAQACAVAAGSASPAATALLAGSSAMPMLTTALAGTLLVLGGGWAIVTALGDPPPTPPPPAPAPAPPRLDLGMNASFWYLSVVEWQYAPDQGTPPLPDDLVPQRQHAAYFCHVAGSDHLNKVGEPLPVRVVPWIAVLGDAVEDLPGEQDVHLQGAGTKLTHRTQATLSMTLNPNAGFQLTVGQQRIDLLQHRDGWLPTSYGFLSFCGNTDFIQPLPSDIAQRGRAELADGGTVVWEPAAADGRGRLVIQQPISRRQARVLLPGHTIHDQEGLRVVRQAETLDIDITGTMDAEVTGNGTGGQAQAQTTSRLVLTMTRADGTIAYRGRLGISTTALPLPGVANGTLAALPELCRALARPEVRAQVATWADNPRPPMARIGRRLQDMAERPPTIQPGTER